MKGILAISAEVARQEILAVLLVEDQYLNSIYTQATGLLFY